MRILIAEDSVLLRAGLTRLLIDAGMDVIAAVGDATELLDVVERHQPDLAVVDVRMPPTNTDDGLRAALVIRKRWPEVGMLVLSQYVEERYATPSCSSAPSSLVSASSSGAPLTQRHLPPVPSPPNSRVDGLLGG